MRIHLLCDHKWRDLPNLTALKISLERLGHQVLLSTTLDAHAMIKAFRPDCIVLNHLFSDANRKIARLMKASGAIVVVLPTEGAVRPEFVTLAEGEFSDYTLADLHLCWSQSAAEDICRRWGFDAERAPVAGCNRFDFYHSNFASVVDTREDFCSKYGLDPSRPIITWGTQYCYAHLNGKKGTPEFARWQREFADVGASVCYERIGVDPDEIPTFHAEGRQISARAFFVLTKAMPNAQFLIKPHPVEELDFYRREIEQSGCTNIRFCPANYIWNVLNASDIQLHRHCTTAIESWMSQRPTIEMDFGPSVGLSWVEREGGSDSASNPEELIAIVSDYLSGRHLSQECLDYRRDYVERWFGPQDGKRCSETAKLLHCFLEKHGRRRQYFQAIVGLNTTPVKSLGALLRYSLNRLPDAPFFRPMPKKKATVSFDKLITRGDVAAYAVKLESVVS